MNNTFAGKRVWILAPIVALACTGLAADGQEPPSAADTGCLACHHGIEPIRDPNSEMMQQIRALGIRRGDPAGCVVCHGGDPEAETAEAAHRGPKFYPDPGSPWVNEHTCGRCHDDHVRTQWNGLMMTEAGKIQGTAWAFGLMDNYDHIWGNYAAENPDDPNERYGTPAYRSYMTRLKQLQPGVFPDALRPLPPAPTDLAALHDHPEQAAFTYQRNQCQRCHLAVRGRQTRGDYRGMGCSSCHIPYSNEGYYEGRDPTIPHDQPGHMLVHQIQATRDAAVSVHGQRYTGIPVETCTTCHDRGKRIGVSYQGLMESAYTSPFTEGGGGQLPLHTKHYIAMQEDIHYQKGMLCQDCHSSNDVHGDGFLECANLAQVEIECSDCHGTPDAFPWELPLGYMDEFGPPPAAGPARGVAHTLLPREQQGTTYPVEDGYLISARGNPLGNVVRRGDAVVVHTAGGKDLDLAPLKLRRLRRELSREARVAMCQVGKHIETMECYACHASWAPQCYGCHVHVDYSQQVRSFDWVAAGRMHQRDEHLADRGENGYDTKLPGKVTEQRSYLRWENPALGVNGEGRVTPVMPGCQVSVTVVGPDGKTIIRNHIFHTAPNTEGSGPEGQLGIDMSPVQPHTIGHARSCESCHVSEKALGYGIGGGRLNRPWNQPHVVDLMTADGHVLPRRARTQIEPVEGLEADWSRFVTEDGRQLQTVGHHFTGSGPLSNEQRANMSRTGVCLSCHEEIPAESLAVNLLHHAAKYADALPHDETEHAQLLHKILLMSAWGQVTLPAVVAVIVLGAIACRWRRRRRNGRATADGKDRA